MKWTPGADSSNVEDRRGEGGVGGGMGRGVGLGGGAILLVLSLVFGHNFFNDVAPDPNAAATTARGANSAGGPVAESPQEHEEVQFITYVLDDVQGTWARILGAQGVQYSDAKLVLFRNSVQSGCGVAQSASGPFYCPVDQKAYIDLGFYEELRTRFGAPGQFAQAYVLAHELGHHVQHLLGTDARVRQLEESRPQAANQLSVRLELQADCYAGVWANTTQQRRLLEAGDVDQALGAASAVGDDRIQQQETGTVHPESFTHGTAEQRASWFKRGFSSGNPTACDTFAGGL